ncbi:MAG: pyridoxamine 5'-phosphate oxidase family protein [Thaumarchaeota archaeon]|nr:pyridoxamine 5'-phosphate oxidase family protein [Nitrososphaerota archaeon]
MRKALTKEHLRYLEGARVARLATSDLKGSVSLVPIVFACNSDAIFFVVDKKSKQPGKTLKRLSNISENPIATVLIDRYSEEWKDLSYLVVKCDAKILHSKHEKQNVAKLLKEKYEQYRSGGYFPEDLEEAVIVKLRPKKAVFWQNLRTPVP